jgi:hypothetical protein
VPEAQDDGLTMEEKGMGPGNHDSHVLHAISSEDYLSAINLYRTTLVSSVVEVVRKPPVQYSKTEHLPQHLKDHFGVEDKHRRPTTQIFGRPFWALQADRNWLSMPAPMTISCILPDYAKK